MDKLNRNVGFMTNKISNKLKRYVAAELEEYGITAEQWVITYTLYQSKQFNQKQLAVELEKDPVTVARIIEILIRKGFVAKEVSKDDRRAYIVALTEEGKKLVNELNVILNQGLYSRVMTSVPKEKKEAYLDVLRIMDKNLSDLRVKSEKRASEE